jgi:hypothetical protein
VQWHLLSLSNWIDTYILEIVICWGIQPTSYLHPCISTMQLGQTS